jgi:hypothetical protein
MRASCHACCALKPLPDTWNGVRHASTSTTSGTPLATLRTTARAADDTAPNPSSIRATHSTLCSHFLPFFRSSSITQRDKIQPICTASDGSGSLCSHHITAHQESKIQPTGTASDGSKSDVASRIAVLARWLASVKPTVLPTAHATPNPTTGVSAAATTANPTASGVERAIVSGGACSAMKWHTATLSAAKQLARSASCGSIATRNAAPENDAPRKHQRLTVFDATDKLRTPMHATAAAPSGNAVFMRTDAGCPCVCRMIADATPTPIAAHAAPFKRSSRTAARRERSSALSGAIGRWFALRCVTNNAVPRKNRCVLASGVSGSNAKKAVITAVVVFK